MARKKKEKNVSKPIDAAPLMPVEAAENVAPKKTRRPSCKKDKTVEGVLPLTLGMILQQARHQKHMKLPSIAKKLCIKEVYLDALENGHYYAFPALVYGAGFLRTYARFLGLNADEMAALFRQETTDIPAETADVPRLNDPSCLPSGKTIFKSLIAFGLLYLAWSIFKVMTYNPFPEPAMPIFEQVKPVVTGVPLTVNSIQTVPVIESEKTLPVPVVSKPEQPVMRAVGVSYGLREPARVSFVATDTVQIEIQDTEADSIVFKKTLKAGDRYNPVADTEGLVLRTTNAGGLDVYVDDKKIKTLGKKGQIKAGVQMDAASFVKE